LPENTHNSTEDDAQNDALSVNLPSSAALSMLAKVVAGLSASERVAMALLLIAHLIDVLAIAAN
jgi:hypothetical protein